MSHVENWGTTLASFFEWELMQLTSFLWWRKRMESIQEKEESVIQKMVCSGERIFKI